MSGLVFVLCLAAGGRSADTAPTKPAGPPTPVVYASAIRSEKADGVYIYGYTSPAPAGLWTFGRAGVQVAYNNGCYAITLRKVFPGSTPADVRSPVRGLLRAVCLWAVGGSPAALRPDPGVGGVRVGMRVDDVYEVLQEFSGGGSVMGGVVLESSAWHLYRRAGLQVQYDSGIHVLAVRRYSPDK